MKRLTVAVSVAVVLALASVALAAGTLSGTYKTTIGSAPLGGALKGTWTIKFNSPDYTVTDNGTAVIHGKYSITGTKITFNDKSGKDACPSPGVYKFTLNGSKLKFTRVSDSATKCAGREGVLAGSYTKLS
jgi:hypothetical protein